MHLPATVETHSEHICSFAPCHERHLPAILHGNLRQSHLVVCDIRHLHLLAVNVHGTCQCKLVADDDVCLARLFKHLLQYVGIEFAQGQEHDINHVHSQRDGLGWEGKHVVLVLHIAELRTVVNHALVCQKIEACKGRCSRTNVYVGKTPTYKLYCAGSVTNTNQAAKYIYMFITIGPIKKL